MKIKVTIAQMNRILKDYPPKYPMILKMKGIPKDELDEFISRLKKK